jgi:hypothetical protein
MRKSPGGREVKEYAPSDAVTWSVDWSSSPSMPLGPNQVR